MSQESKEILESNYETDVILPSLGLIYGDKIPEGKVTIRQMTTKDEKYILGSSSLNSLTKLIKACIVNPKGLSDVDFSFSDTIFLLIAIRSHSYGEEYDMKIKCSNPECEHEGEYTVKLSDFPVTYLNPTALEPKELTLKRSKKTIKIKMLSNEDVSLIENTCAKLSKTLTSTLDKRNLRNIYNKAQSICEIEGKDDLSIYDKAKFVKDLPMIDSIQIESAYDHYFSYGIETLSTLKCEDCGETLTTSFFMNPEFFRPHFDFD